MRYVVLAMVILTASVLSTVAPAQAADVYRCTDKAGHTSFAATPCDVGSTQKSVKVQVAPSYADCPQRVISQYIGQDRVPPTRTYDLPKENAELDCDVRLARGLVEAIEKRLSEFQSLRSAGDSKVQAAAYTEHIMYNRSLLDQARVRVIQLETQQRMGPNYAKQRDAGIEWANRCNNVALQKLDVAGKAKCQEDERDLKRQQGR